jgi:hypothetical protein
MWYDSKILAVVVGALLGFALSFIPQRLERRRERRALEHALIAEVERIVAYLADRKATYVRYRGMIAEGGRLGIYTTDRSFDTVYRANVGKVTVLSKEMVKPLVEFYDSVNEFSGRIRALSSSLEKFNTGADSLTNTSFFIGSLDKLVEVIDRIVEQGMVLQQFKSA